MLCVGRHNIYWTTECRTLGPHFRLLGVGPLGIGLTHDYWTPGHRASDRGLLRECRTAARILDCCTSTGLLGVGQLQECVRLCVCVCVCIRMCLCLHALLYVRELPYMLMHCLLEVTLPVIRSIKPVNTS